MNLIKLLINRIHTNLTKVFIIMQQNSTTTYDARASRLITDPNTKDKLSMNVHVTCRETGCKAIVPVTPEAHKCKSCNEIICNKCHNHVTTANAYVGSNIQFNGKCNTCIWFELG